MLVIQFSSPDTTLETAGGKGANLARLTRAGFDVPPGFVITTDAYNQFVRANNLADEVSASLTGLSTNDASQLETASARIRLAFSAGMLPAEIKTAIRENYNSPKPVAVRSSATAEDLPDLSFAGQQDTFLNVIGEEKLLKAVVDCWSSLWTARAIGYRLRNGISNKNVAIAVVVQEMAQSDVSGVLFTANPLTGLRSELVIDATFGLGEALVSGQVEPDHFVVDSLSGAIVRKTLGSKKLSTRGKTGGGVENVVEEAGARQTLSDEEIRQLEELGRRVQGEYNFPQDIEWAFAQGKLYLLQSRAITSLFPLPAHDKYAIWFSFGAVQGVLAPLTPLGSDTFQCVFAGGAQIFDVNVAYNEQKVLVPAGERLWIKVSDLMRHPLGNRVFGSLLGFIEPSIGQILHGLADEPQLGAGKGRIKLSTVRRLAGFALLMLGRFASTVYNPEKARADFDNLIERELSKAQITVSGDVHERLRRRLDFMKVSMTNAFPVLLPRFIPVFGPAMGMLNLLTRLTTDSAGTDHGLSMLALDVTRGVPNNVTTEMDLALWATATAIRADPASLVDFTSTDASALALRYRNGTLPKAAHKAIAVFMSRYGMRGVGEIDIGQPRWRDDPTPIMQTLQSYLQITDPNAAPDVQFERGKRTAEEAIEKMAATVRKQRGGFIKEKLVRFAARRVRILLGVREAPKFYAVRMIGIARQELIKSGREMADAGVFEHTEEYILPVHSRAGSLLQ